MDVGVGVQWVSHYGSHSYVHLRRSAPLVRLKVAVSLSLSTTPSPPPPSTVHHRRRVCEPKIALHAGVSVLRRLCYHQTAKTIWGRPRDRERGAQRKRRISAVTVCGSVCRPTQCARVCTILRTDDCGGRSVSSVDNVMGARLRMVCVLVHRSWPIGMFV